MSATSFRFEMPVGTRVGRPARAFAVGAVLAVLSACAPEQGSDPVYMESVHRFAGRKLDQRIDTSPIPAASIGDERRFVLRAPRSGVMIWRVPIPVGPDSSVRVRIPLPPPYDRATKVLGSLYLETGKTQITLDPQIYPTRSEDGPAVFDHTVVLPPGFEDAKSVDVSFRGMSVGSISFARYVTRPIPVPHGARLEFGIGIVEPEHGNDPVEFVVSICIKMDCKILFREVVDPRRPEGRRWLDRQVSLEKFPGKNRRFVFETHRHKGAAPFSVPVWSSPTVYAPRPRGADDVNLILLSIDTLRADHLPTYGYALDTAPFLEERFGRGGSVFEQCTAASTATTPSHMTMFTALPPTAHGATDGFKSLSHKIATLPERIRAAGLDTAAFTENGWVSVQQGFARGFNIFAENKSPDIMTPEGEVDETFDQARRWLERNHDKRFFLFLHTYQVHSPYAPPPRYQDLFPPDAEQYENGELPIHVKNRVDYDREIRFTDDELRRLFQDLERLGIADKTIFVVTSDHGEEFLEHGLVFHGGNLFEESIRVPLLFSGPGIEAGHRISTPVSHLSLLPTLLELLNLPVPEELGRRSLVGPMRDPVVRPPDTSVFSEAWVTYQPGIGGRGRRFYPPSFSVREGSRKLTRHRKKDGSYRIELYDLTSDPGETNDLRAEHPDEVARLSQVIERYETEQARVHAGFYGEKPTPGTEVSIDEEQKKKLRALGYIE